MGRGGRVQARNSGHMGIPLHWTCHGGRVAVDNGGYMDLPLHRRDRGGDVTTECGGHMHLPLHRMGRCGRVAADRETVAMVMDGCWWRVDVNGSGWMWMGVDGWSSVQARLSLTFAGGP